PVERVEENLSLRFSRKGPEFTVGLLHANVGGNGAHASYAPASWDDLARAELDYWALGHVHAFAERRLANGGTAVYSGNRQGRHARETGPKGCVVVDVEEGRLRHEFVPVDSVRWHEVRVDASGRTDLTALEHEVQETVGHACREDRAAHAVRVVLEGRT